MAAEAKFRFKEFLVRFGTGSYAQNMHDSYIPYLLKFYKSSQIIYLLFFCNTKLI